MMDEPARRMSMITRQEQQKEGLLGGRRSLANVKNGSNVMAQQEEGISAVFSRNPMSLVIRRRRIRQE